MNYDVGHFVMDLRNGFFFSSASFRFGYHLWDLAPIELLFNLLKPSGNFTYDQV
jgi:hypothetical protein